MPSFNHVVECEIPRSIRTQQLEAMFDVPGQAKSRLEWNVKMPIEDRDWQIGLIVGPSGAGKSQLARRIWGEAVDHELAWDSRATIDNFSEDLSMEKITAACMAVGFNTIPSWMRPFHVLSNGERFRAELARRLLEGGDTVVVDEFTSVVDRQVAQIASHAVQKFVRRQPGKQFVAVTCHYDVLDWLQPDWVYDPSTQEFAWRSLQRRPELNITISPIPYAGWKVFAPFHYLTADLNKCARCFGLFVDGRLAAFAGMLFRPLNRDMQPIMGCSRLVTLPDFQGLGLAFVLIEAVGSIYKAVGKRVHTYPAHPALIRGFDKSRAWAMRKKPGTYSPRVGATSTIGAQGGRPCAVFSYEGPAVSEQEALRVLSYFDQKRLAVEVNRALRKDQASPGKESAPKTPAGSRAASSKGRKPKGRRGSRSRGKLK